MTRGSATLAAACLAFASTASAAPPPAANPPAPADAKQAPPPTEPVPADPLATDAVPEPPPSEPSKPAAKPELSEAETMVVRAGLDIDTAEAGPSGPIIVSRMEELGNLELRRAEILPSRLGTDPVIRIRVALQPGSSDVFVVHSEIAVRGQALEGSAKDNLCSLCTESEVVDRARGEIVRLVPFVRAQFRAAKVEPKVEPKPEPKPQPDTRLATKGKAGIGLLAGGVVALGAGIGLSLAKNPADPDNAANVINIHPAGYAVLAVGAAAIITGAVLLALDRKQAKQRTVRLVPTGGPTSAGLVLIGRF